MKHSTLYRAVALLAVVALILSALLPVLSAFQKGY
jgi:hypothetical protein